MARIAAEQAKKGRW